MKLSLVIPCLSKTDHKLLELLRSIDAQDFPKDEMEVLVITEGTSESAKAIGIRRAKGEVIGILASDNELTRPDFLRASYINAVNHGATFPAYYQVNGDSLNRYFALIGGNDPLSYYMNKNDRLPHYELFSQYCSCGKSLGDNGFFVKRELINKTDLYNYYHVDNACEVRVCAIPNNHEIFHNTGGNIFHFFAKRYRYGLQHAFNKNRRWHLVDFKQPTDIRRLAWFILASLTIIHPLLTSIRGYLKLRDMAWFMHPIACLFTVFTYGGLMIHVLVRRMFQSSSVPMVAPSR